MANFTHVAGANIQLHETFANSNRKHDSTVLTVNVSVTSDV